MNDVAKAAGVHQTTVSLALRRHPSIPEATRERILETARKLGYRPNPLIAALMGQLRNRQRKGRARRTGVGAGAVLAYLTNHPAKMPWRKETAFSAMFTGAVACAEELGFALQEFDLAADGMSPERMRDILLARGIRGIIIAPLPGDQTRLELDIEGFAVVSLGVSLQSPQVERIANDHYQSMQVAFRQCLRRGCQRIGFLISRELSDRLEGRWLAAFLREQLQVPASRRLRPLLLPSFMRHKCEAGIGAWLSEEKPDVVLAPLAAWQHDWRRMILQLAGNPDTGVVNLTLPPDPGNFSGIQQNAQKLGRIAVERVAARLQHNDLGPLHIIQNTMLHGEWHDGETLPDRAGETKR
ncbi:MAG: LacI family transcriptional regulator [Opitutaceae bacterium]|jgi:DNA-binding LacI/PurR family transcriptional regulator|nr:LacI family transcriptional regulator [Opitutaceae bacterium]